MLKKLINQNPLYVFAIERESGDLFRHENVLYTGLGKLNAAYRLTKEILINRPSIIINLGSAGSSKFAQGSVVCCSAFVQRDMDTTALGVKKYVTPFSTNEVILNYGFSITFLDRGVCGTGDDFVSDHDSPDYDVIDMEAFAVATIARQENIPFLCLKYIADGANDKAVKDWNLTVDATGRALYDTMQDIKNRENEGILYF